MTAVQVETRRPRANADDELDHYYCCDENVSLCGLDITDLPVNVFGDDDLCIVCDDLCDSPCDDPDCPDRSP